MRELLNTVSLQIVITQPLLLSIVSGVKEWAIPGRRIHWFSEREGKWKQ